MNPPDDTKQHEQEEACNSTRATFSGFLFFPSADCFISFLDNNVHLIRSRDQQTHRHRQLTHRKFVASCGPLYQHTGEPFAVFHPSLIFSLFFPLGLLEFSKRALAFCFDLGLFYSGGAFLNSNLSVLFPVYLSPTLWRWAWETGLGFWAKPGCDFGGLGGERRRNLAVMGFCAVFWKNALDGRRRRTTQPSHRHFLLSSVLR
jgi:hypothetical protein